MKSELPGNVIRPADFLENLHPAAAANDRQFRDGRDLGAGCHLVFVSYGQTQMSIANDVRGQGAAARKLSKQQIEIVIARSANRELDSARSWPTVDGESGRIRPAIAQRAQHAREHCTEFWFEFGVLQKETHNAAHAL
jgi:hypothetical protein